MSYLFDHSIERAFIALRRGVFSIHGEKTFKLFRPEELEQLICGCKILDINELRMNTRYEGGYDETAQIVVWFWEIVNEFDWEQKRKLLAFVTGSDRAPLKGLQSLTFVVQRQGPDSESLPTSHTCFGVLLLPEYSSMRKLKFLLSIAINNARGFGLI